MSAFSPAPGDADAASLDTALRGVGQEHDLGGEAPGEEHVEEANKRSCVAFCPAPGSKCTQVSGVQRVRLESECG